MSKIDNSSYPPKQPDSYRNEFIRGKNLLKNTMQEYSSATEPHKKELLQKVLNETKTVLDQIINSTLQGEKRQKVETKLNKDFNKFIANSNSSNMNTLNNDLNDVEKMI